MPTSRRFFLKQLAGVMSAVLGGIQLSGCLLDGSDQSASAPPATQADSATTAATAPATQPSPAAPAATTPASVNVAPVWQPSPTIEFVEGVPAVVSVRDFVQDPNKDPLVIAMTSGALIPGVMWNPTNATISYDGRPLGAKPDEPVVVSGIVFTADDKKN